MNTGLVPHVVALIFSEDAACQRVAVKVAESLVRRNARNWREVRARRLTSDHEIHSVADAAHASVSLLPGQVTAHGGLEVLMVLCRLAGAGAQSASILQLSLLCKHSPPSKQRFIDLKGPAVILNYLSQATRHLALAKTAAQVLPSPPRSAGLVLLS